jgi:histidine triad (HIT) family protein
MNRRNKIIFFTIVAICLAALNSCSLQQTSGQYFLDGSKRIPTYDAALLTDDCIFCKIIRGAEPAKIIAENNDVLVFESIRPQHQSHWLIIPKKHIKDLKAITDADTTMMGKLLQAAGTLVKQLQKPQACNLALNEGKEAGQTVFHLHIHFYSDSSLLTQKLTL